MSTRRRKAVVKQSHYRLVRNFQKKFCIGIMDVSGHFSRCNHIREELEEYERAFDKGNKADMLDALIDLTYVILGTAVMHGFDKFDKGFKRVHDANMKKVRVKGIGGHKFGVCKPKGWKPPVMEDLV